MGRFYPIIDLAESGDKGPPLARELAESNCEMLQVRAKGATSAQFFTFAQQVVQAVGNSCRVIVNDRFDIALAVGAAGVHLGEYDLPVGRVRKISPSGFIIGATCRDPRMARLVEKEGADYIGAGAVYKTGSKSDTRLIGLEGLASVAAAVKIPVYGIAGITLDNCGEVVRAGAFGAAGITVISRASDPGETYRELEKALQRALSS